MFLTKYQNLYFGFIIKCNFMITIFIKLNTYEMQYLTLLILKKFTEITSQHKISNYFNQWSRNDWRVFSLTNVSIKNNFV